MQFQIPAQDLETALYQYADQAHVSLALPRSGVSGVRSAAVSGAHTPEEALRLLLLGSGYSYAPAGVGAFRIVARPHIQDADNAVESIIVTAARRPLPLNELPRSVTHLDEAALQEMNARDLNGIAMGVSGLTRTNVGLGRDKELLRGVSDGALTGTSQSTVGLYFNGLRLTYSAPDPDLKLVDIRDIDVLRGPQGALYGAGSIGGIVQIESNPVDLDDAGVGGAAEVSSPGSGHEGSNLEAVANLPLIQDRLGIRAVAYNEKFGGWLDDPLIGVSDANSAHRRGGRLTTTFKEDGWDASLFGIYQTIGAQDSQYVELDHRDRDERDTHLLEPHDNDFLTIGFALHLTLPFGEINSTTAHLRHQISNRYDATGSFAELGVDPSRVRPFDEKQTLDISIHETRISSREDARVPWLLGVFYADGDNRRNNLLRDGAAGVWDGIAYAENRTDALDESAVFGEISWPLTSRLSLSTGLRLFRFHARAQSLSEAPLLANTEQFEGVINSTGAAPDVRLSYQVNENTVVYLSAARGYRGGGFNTGGPEGETLSAQQPFRRFAGDDLIATELGGRTTTFEGRLNLAAALFYYRWNNVQTDSLVSNDFPYTGNVGDGTALGFEAEVRYAMTEEWAFAANLLVNRPRLGEHTASFPGLAVDTFPGAPELSAGLAIHYRHSLGWQTGDWSAYADGEVAYVGPAVASFESAAHIGGYVSGDIQVGLKHDVWDLSLYIDNVAGADDRTFAFGNPYAGADKPFTTPPSPRVVGMRLRRNF